MSLLRSETGTHSATIEAIYHRTMRLSIQSFGPHCHRALQQGALGRVAAVFERSIYLEFPEGFVCIGPAVMGDGPLNAIVAQYDISDWRKYGLYPDKRVQVANAAAWIEGRIQFSFCGVRIWTPPLRHADWPCTDLQTGLETLERATCSRLPTQGLARLALGSPSVQPDTPLSRRAQPPIEALRRWLNSVLMTRTNTATDTDLNQAIGLLGMGPGLTPSGDDILGGTLIALHVLGFDDIRECLARTMLREIRRLTTPISAAHLRAAAEGMGNAAVHALLHAVLGPDTLTIKAAVDRISKLGHTSGWDTLAGVVIVLRSLMNPLNFAPSFVQERRPWC
ncbi:MAG: DUF2877 domain-containing protein [Gammaproteobacteria bacterium]|nr:DUF2877 domain-containing protein [Gammaproteobacteria bacterium]